MRRVATACVACALAAFNWPSSQAADWGYEDEPVPAVPSAPAAHAIPARAQAAQSARAGGPQGQRQGAHGGSPSIPPPARDAVRRQVSVLPAIASPPAVPPVPAKAPVDRLKQATDSWAQIYEMSSPTPLSADQRERVKNFYASKYRSSPLMAQEVLSATAFIPTVNAYLGAHPEQRDNYTFLFRSLLRFRCRVANRQPAQASAPADPSLSEERDVISEILGPVRIAQPGPPPLTEEAVDAYADMACFLYEQKNPGKTIDATDNRAMFAQVVCDKFKRAPLAKDREAMANFDLAWSKFKIVWTSKDEKARKDLLESLVKTGAGQAWKTTSSPPLELVLKNWPGS